jgi:hypothetical protein
MPNASGTDTDSEMGIDFQNILSPTEAFNMYTYRNFYNGGGVAIGDVNNDGLADVYFCGNMVDNKLYLNQGGFKFKDITESAGVACKNVWSSGVSMADVNGDGWLDIYVCKSGSPGGENRHNELFINNGSVAEDGSVSFTERAEEYGIADEGLSTHAAFFDYDRDGDLDVYLLNNSFRPVGGYDIRPGQREVRDTLGGNKLYRNDDGQFVDVSAAAGIYGSAIGFGLGVTIGDVDRDGWQDIFVSNDFFEKDYLYINQQDGTFREALEDQIREISMGSMGADMADINNDLLPDIFVTDMLPEDDARYKTKTTFENWDKYQLNVKNDYYHQFTRNVLHLNNGNNSFSEIGRFAGVHATDWSWGALIFDMDNDGQRDIFVANGIYKDLTDQDYINFMADPATVRKILKKEKGVILQLMDSIPSVRIPNYAFVNQGDLTFVNKASEWGLATPSHSNGSAYGDLDNDGDFDLVVNNVNMPSFIYENRTEQIFPNHHYLKIKLRGKAPNTFGLGAQVTVFAEDQMFYQEMAPMRGFQSSVDYNLIFGLGSKHKIDSVYVQWLDGSLSKLGTTVADQTIEIAQEDAAPAALFQRTANYPGDDSRRSSANNVFKNSTTALGLDYQHRENNFIDFDREQLLYQMISAEGPKLCVGDVNGDGLEDVFVGGAKESAGALFLQNGKGQFEKMDTPALEADRISEDTGCIFFDVDGDADLDLYVASGGNEFPSSSNALRDRLYINDGNGHFTKSDQLLPAGKYESTACVDAADFDGDGDLDLVVGLRLKPFLYGVPVNAYLLLNENGRLQNVTKAIAPDLEEEGMFTDMRWLDYDNDGDPDLITVGDWMPVQVFENDGGRFTNKTETARLKQTNGFWNCLKTGDFNNDGLVDLVVGNHGQNTRLKAKEDQPVQMYVNDFDRNGTAEQIVTVYNGGASYPLVLRHDLVKQLPALKKKYLRYVKYKEQTIEDIFTPAQLENVVLQSVFTTETSVFINKGDGTFERRALPIAAQLAPVYGLAVKDFDGDGNLDIVTGGNFYRSKPEIGKYDASYGLFLRGDGKGNFLSVSANDSGFFVKGEIRDLELVEINGAQHLLIARNDDTLLSFEILE